MTRTRVLVGLFLLAIGCSAALASLRVAARGRFASPYSTYGAGPDGTRALLRLSQALGFRAEPFARELSSLAPGTLVAIGGCRGGLTRALARPEREALKSFVEAGGLLIVAGVPEYLPEGTGLRQDLVATCEDQAERGVLDRMLSTDGDGDDEADPGERVPFESEAIPVGPPLSHVLPFTVDRAFSLRVEPDVEATELISSESGPLGLTTTMGRGRVVLLGIPEALTNRNVAAGGGVVFARLIEAFAPKGPVRFDEYHLGMGERRSVVRYLRDLGYAPTLFSLSLVIVALLWASGLRVGPPEEEPPRATRSSQRYVSALAALYARTEDRGGALSVLGRDALVRIARHYRATNVAPNELGHWLRAQGLSAVAAYVERIESQTSEPLSRGETLDGRARAIEQDVTAAIVLGTVP